VDLSDLHLLFQALISNLLSTTTPNPRCKAVVMSEALVGGYQELLAGTDPIAVAAHKAAMLPLANKKKPDAAIDNEVL
jgi:hypothetical protein